MKRLFLLTSLGLALSACSGPDGAVEVKDHEALEGAATASRSAAAAIATQVKGVLKGMSSSEFKAQLRHEYVRLHFLDRSGRWMFPEAERIAGNLVPANLTMEEVNAFVDTMARNMEDNPYMMKFLDAARPRSFPTLKTYFEREGARVIPQAVAAAYAFEKVTQAELNDPKFIKALSFYWEKERARAGVSFEQTGLFGMIKLASVERPIRKIAEFHDGKPLDPAFLRGFLSLNILEAIAADNITKNGDNAAAGWPLYNNPAGDSVANAKLGTGPATFTADGKRLEIRYALPKQWDDLYQVWNMAFVSQIGSYPMWISKLLVPAMSGYKGRPEEYIYRRALSLYTALHYMTLTQIEDKIDGIPAVNWKDDDVTRLWGEINRQSAKDYENQVAAAKR